MQINQLFKHSSVPSVTTYLLLLLKQILNEGFTVFLIYSIIVSSFCVSHHDVEGRIHTDLHDEFKTFHLKYDAIEEMKYENMNTHI